jgi:hypothetical protein
LQDSTKQKLTEETSMEIRGGIELPVAFCSPEDGKFLSAPHTYKDCTITLSSHRGNDEVKAVVFCCCT